MTAVNMRMLQPGERIRVLVVDDSVVIRRLITHALEEDRELEWWASRPMAQSPCNGYRNSIPMC